MTTGPIDRPFSSCRRWPLNGHGIPIGSLIDGANRHDVGLLEPTSTRTVQRPGDIGSVWERFVYHNFYATRFDSPTVPPSQTELDSGVTAIAAAAAWRLAIHRYLAEPLAGSREATPQAHRYLRSAPASCLHLHATMQRLIRSAG